MSVLKIKTSENTWEKVSGSNSSNVSGVSSWNDLTDKPFQKTNDHYSIRWDGRDLGLGATMIPDSYIKVSDKALSKDEIIGAHLIYNVKAEQVEQSVDEIITEDMIEIYNDDLILILDLAYFALKEVTIEETNADGETISVGTIPSAGVWIKNINDVGFKLQIGEIEDFNLELSKGELKKLDSEFIPSWDNIDLNDRPFGKTEFYDEIFWDGNTRGLEYTTVNMPEATYKFYKVSDKIYEKEDLLGYTLSINAEFNGQKEGSTVSFSSEVFDNYFISVDTGYLSKYIAFIKEPGTITVDQEAEITYPSAGVWMMDTYDAMKQLQNIELDYYTIQLSKGSVKTLEPQYVPHWDDIDLNKKPFGKVKGQIHLKWDGRDRNLGTTTIDGVGYYKISNDITTKEDNIGLVCKTKLITSSGEFTTEIVVSEDIFENIDENIVRATDYYSYIAKAPGYIYKDQENEDGTTTKVQVGFIPSPGLWAIDVYGGAFEEDFGKIEFFEVECNKGALRKIDPEFIPSWEEIDLVDKPFGETKDYDEISWDGSREGLDYIEIISSNATQRFYKITDRIFEQTDLLGYTLDYGMTSEIPYLYFKDKLYIDEKTLEDNIQLSNDQLFIFVSAVFVKEPTTLEEDGTTITFPSAGVWVMDQALMYETAYGVPCKLYVKLFKGNLKTIDPKYLPNWDEIPLEKRPFGGDRFEFEWDGTLGDAVSSSVDVYKIGDIEEEVYPSRLVGAECSITCSINSTEYQETYIITNVQMESGEDQKIFYSIGLEVNNTQIGGLFFVNEYVFLGSNISLDKGIYIVYNLESSISHLLIEKGELKTIDPIYLAPKGKAGQVLSINEEGQMVWVDASLTGETLPAAEEVEF